ncbi:DUF3558 domain-containing protein [Amycolatopsis benzoatilytica]|uniref:DUF3558 domain-containing protein n=1 Tax=Amycolatopsis benzoatilytica TaxID=346045 RepID=UPI0004870D0E|nr:DUF3558 domain-containing protein [Amycolatopsis benzoatilytica]
MTRRTVQIAVGAFAAVGLLSACSGGGNSGAAQPSVPASSPANASTATGSGNTDPSLKVSAPLSTQALVGNPCTALGDGDASTLGLATPGKPMNSGGLTGCQWVSTQFAENTVGIIPVTLNKNGLSDIYALKARQAYFEPLTVEGYPAVFANQLDDRKDGSCNLYVGVTDQLAVATDVGIGTGRNRATPCDAAKQIATAMVKHLKTAS